MTGPNPQCDFDVAIIGSGASGTWAAHQCCLHNLKVAVLDIGFRPQRTKRVRKNFFELKKSREVSQLLAGDQFQCFANCFDEYRNPKLNAPRFDFVTREANSLFPVESEDFSFTQSAAAGGLANAWGAGVYRYTEGELSQAGIPNLDSYYDQLTAKIGISGKSDDLSRYFGSDQGLQRPYELSQVASLLYQNYQKKRSLFHKRGFNIGFPRLAVLSSALQQREPYEGDQLAFWDSSNTYVYNPRLTLDKLIEESKLHYLPQHQVVKFAESKNGVSVYCERTDSKQSTTVRAKKIILAAGALNSARIALLSSRYPQSKLPILDNRVSIVPFVAPSLIGTPTDMKSHGMAQLNVIYEGEHSADRLQGTIYNFSALLHSEVLPSFPLPMQSGILAGKYLLPGFSVVSLFHPDRSNKKNYLEICPNGTLRVTYKYLPNTQKVEKHFISTMRRIGFHSHIRLNKQLPPGNGIHYAGTLPFSAHSEDPMTTDGLGRLRFTKNVYVSDASVFSSLPSKNHTFTVMANSMRIGDFVSESLQ